MVIYSWDFFSFWIIHKIIVIQIVISILGLYFEISGDNGQTDFWFTNDVHTVFRQSMEIIGLILYSYKYSKVLWNAPSTMVIHICQILIEFFLPEFERPPLFQGRHLLFLRLDQIFITSIVYSKETHASRNIRRSFKSWKFVRPIHLRFTYEYRYRLAKKIDLHFGLTLMINYFLLRQIRK